MVFLLLGIAMILNALITLYENRGIEDRSNYMAFSGKIENSSSYKEEEDEEYEITYFSLEGVKDTEYFLDYQVNICFSDIKKEEEAGTIVHILVEIDDYKWNQGYHPVEVCEFDGGTSCRMPLSAYIESRTGKVRSGLMVLGALVTIGGYRMMYLILALTVLAALAAFPVYYLAWGRSGK